VKTLIFIALDGLSTEEERTLRLAELLSRSTEARIGFKVNLDYLLAPGKTLEDKLAPIIETGRPVFADIKMWNGRRTMTRVVEHMLALGVEYFNVYALAGQPVDWVVEAARARPCRVLALTVLTHYDDAYCNEMFYRSLSDSVRALTILAMQMRCDGVILPGTTLPNVRDLDIMKVVPGVRPRWYRDSRHKEAVTPRVAVARGADALVVGSPVMESSNPISALNRIAEEIGQ